MTQLVSLRPYLFDQLPWELIKFLDFESGCSFEVGTYIIFTNDFGKCNKFIWQQ